MRVLGCCEYISCVLRHQAYSLSAAPKYVYWRVPQRRKPTISYGDQMAVVPKIAAKDTTLTVSNADGGRTTFPVPSGTDIGIHVAGLHYNRMLCGRCIPGGARRAVSH